MLISHEINVFTVLLQITDDDKQMDDPSKLLNDSRSPYIYTAGQPPPEDYKMTPVRMLIHNIAASEPVLIDCETAGTGVSICRE